MVANARQISIDIFFFVISGIVICNFSEQEYEFLKLFLSKYNIYEHLAEWRKNKSF